LSTAHFSGQGHQKGQPAPNRKAAEQILVQLPAGSKRAKNVQLHRALQDLGVPYACQLCGIGDWRSEPIVLEIDHIDGDWLNNLRENVRYLCPNCHSQTPTYRGRSRRRSLEETTSLPGQRQPPSDEGTREQVPCVPASGRGAEATQTV